MIIFCLDPGYDRLGWAVGQILPGDKIKLLAYGAIITERKKILWERYQQLQQELQALLLEFKPDEVALEALFFFKNQKTVMQVAEARGVILATLLAQKCHIFEYSPLQIKMVVAGFGRADKIALTKMVCQHFKLQPDKKILDDTYDAMAILITHQSSRRFKLLTETI